MMNYPLLSKKMSYKIKTVWRKSTYVSSTIFMMIGVVAVGTLAWFNHLNGVWVWLLGSYFLVGLIIFVFSMLLIPYRYKFYRYEITAEDLAFQKGFIFRSLTYVPMNRIQHVETEQGPFLRQENLMEIVIHTAATSHHIAGLDVQEAMDLRQQIIELIKVVKEDA